MTKLQSSPWDGTPSIWDGWVNQCRGDFVNGDAYCALGWLGGYKFAPEVERRLMQVAQQLPNQSRFGYSVTIAYANNAGMTPDQFRELDRRVEWEYQMKQLGAQG